MTSKTDFTMAGLGFLSVSRWLQYVCNSADLEEVSLSAIFSFSIVPHGPEQLVHQKKHLASVIEKNQHKLIEWVKDTDLAYDSKELVIIRSMFFSNRRSLKVIRGHIATAESLRRFEQNSLFDSVANEGSVDDELPF